jgi:hypothetical protein
MLAKPIAARVRRHRHPVAAALGVAGGDVAEVEVEVLDSKSKALEDAHAGAVEKKDHKLGGSLEVRQNCRHLVAAEDGRQAARLAGTDHIVEPVELDLEHMAVEKEDRRKRLALGRYGHPALHGEVGEEAVEVVSVELARGPPVKLDVAADPGGVGLLGTDGVVADLDLGPHRSMRRRGRRDASAGNC